MKHGHLLAVILPLATLLGCAKENGAPVGDDASTVRIVAETVKTVLSEPTEGNFSVQWTAGDKLGVWRIGASGIGYSESSALASDCTTASFPVSFASAESGTVTYTAVYPSSAVSTSGKVTSITIPTSQTSIDGSFDAAADLLIAAPVEAAGDASELSMRFCRLGSIIRVKVTGLAEDEAVSSVEITSAGTRIAGAYSFNLETGEAEIRTEGELSVTVAANSNVVAARVFSGTYDQLIFDINTNKNHYRKATTKTVVLKPGEVNCFSTEVEPGGALEGDGTSGNPYLIKSVAHLQSMASLLEKGKVTYFNIESDLDLSAIENWAPLNPSADDMGVYIDGKEHTISNMTTSGGKYGSFAGLLSGTIKNLNFDNCSSTATTGSTVSGIICGWVGDQAGNLKGNLENCHVTNSTVTTPSGATAFVVGGITAKLGGSTIKNCSFQGEVINNGTADGAHTGGLAGECYADSTVENVTITGTITAAAAYCAGLVGYAAGCTYKNCTVKADITCGKTSSSYAYAGGIIGYSSGTVNPTIIGCHYEGDLLSNTGKVIAGIIGQTSSTSGTTTIKDCTVKGTIHGNEFVGGIIAYNQKGTLDIDDCTVTAPITCNKDSCGGIISYTANNSTSTITGCRVACDITCGVDGSNNSYCGGIVGQLYNHTTTVEKCSYSGNIKTTGVYTAGILGCAKGSGGTAIAYIRNCSAAGSVKSTRQYAGGISSDIGKNSEITNCYASNTVEGTFGLGGILTRNSNNINPITGGDKTIAVNFNTPVTGCIAWNPSIKSTSHPNVKTGYSGGAVVGFSTTLNTLKNCWRRPDMVFDYHCLDPDLTFLNVLFDHEDADASHPLVENYTDAALYTYYYPYHGKAADAGETASQVAARIGWDATIWDLTGSEPVLK